MKLKGTIKVTEMKEVTNLDKEMMIPGVTIDNAKRSAGRVRLSRLIDWIITRINDRYIIDVTHDELAELIMDRELLAGVEYRITDYQSHMYIPMSSYNGIVRVDVYDLIGNTNHYTRVIPVIRAITNSELDKVGRLETVNSNGKYKSMDGIEIGFLFSPYANPTAGDYSEFTPYYYNSSFGSKQRMPQLAYEYGIITYISDRYKNNYFGFDVFNAVVGAVGVVTTRTVKDRQSIASYPGIYGFNTMGFFAIKEMEDASIQESRKTTSDVFAYRLNDPTLNRFIRRFLPDNFTAGTSESGINYDLSEFENDLIRFDNAKIRYSSSSPYYSNLREWQQNGFASDDDLIAFKFYKVLTEDYNSTRNIYISRSILGNVRTSLVFSISNIPTVILGPQIGYTALIGTDRFSMSDIVLIPANYDLTGGVDNNVFIKDSEFIFVARNLGSNISIIRSFGVSIKDIIGDIKISDSYFINAEMVIDSSFYSSAFIESLCISNSKYSYANNIRVWKVLSSEIIESGHLSSISDYSSIDGCYIKGLGYSYSDYFIVNQIYTPDGNLIDYSNKMYNIVGILRNTKLINVKQFNNLRYLKTLEKMRCRYILNYDNCEFYNLTGFAGYLIGGHKIMPFIADPNSIAHATNIGFYTNIATGDTRDDSTQLSFGFTNNSGYDTIYNKIIDSSDKIQLLTKIQTDNRGSYPNAASRLMQRVVLSKSMSCYSDYGQAVANNHLVTKIQVVGDDKYDLKEYDGVTYDFDGDVVLYTNQ